MRNTLKAKEEEAVLNKDALVLKGTYKSSYKPSSYKYSTYKPSTYKPSTYKPSTYTYTYTYKPSTYVPSTYYYTYTYIPSYNTYIPGYTGTYYNYGYPTVEPTQDPNQYS